MMHQTTQRHAIEPRCPKRVWVLTVLSDDEGRAGQGDLPWGLAFHLSRCDSCRVLADRLLAVGARLSDWREMAPPDPAFVHQAGTEVIAALQAGARPRSSLDIRDDLIEARINAGGGGWARRVRNVAAVAALIVGAVALARHGVWGDAVGTPVVGGFHPEGTARLRAAPVAHPGAGVGANPGADVEPARVADGAGRSAPLEPGGYAPGTAPSPARRRAGTLTWVPARVYRSAVQQAIDKAGGSE